MFICMAICDHVIFKIDTRNLSPKHLSRIMNMVDGQWLGHVSSREAMLCNRNTLRPFTKKKVHILQFRSWNIIVVINCKTIEFLPVTEPLRGCSHGHTQFLDWRHLRGIQTREFS